MTFSDTDKVVSLDQTPSREDAETAVRTLLRWAGDNPDREGLRDTPARVVRSYEEFFSGYKENPVKILSKVFEEVEGYEDMVMLKNVTVESRCEHHILPIIGEAHIAYIPNQRVVGISKLARVIDIFAKRLQTQETLTAQVAETIQKVLEPKGVGLIITAEHQCMTTRGVSKRGVSMHTSHFTGVFTHDSELRERFLKQTKQI